MTQAQDLSSDAILDIISEEGLVARDSLSLQSRLADLGIPSLEMVNILFAVEDRFGVIVEPEDLSQAVTLQDLLDIVTARLPAPSA